MLETLENTGGVRVTKAWLPSKNFGFLWLRIGGYYVESNKNF